MERDATKTQIATATLVHQLGEQLNALRAERDAAVAERDSKQEVVEAAWETLGSLRAENARLREAVEAAYREGFEERGWDVEAGADMCWRESNAIRSLPLSAAASGWRDIETAPRDGSRFIAWFPKCPQLPRGGWHETQWNPRMRVWLHPFFVEPTHWLPAPAPPSTEETP